MPKPGADTGITAADEEEVHAGILSGIDCSVVIEGRGGGRITSPEPEGYIHETDQRWDFYQRSDHANESLPGIQPRDCDCKAITPTLSLSNTRTRPPYTGFVQVGFPDT